MDPKVSAIVGILVLIEQAVGGGTILLTNAIPEAWIPIVKSWCLILAFIGSSYLTAGHVFSSATPGPLAPPQTVQEATNALLQAKKIAMLFFLAVALSLMVGNAHAQGKIKLPIDPLGLNKKSASASASTSPPAACDFNLFASLTAETVLQQINGCIQSQVSDAANLFLPDVTNALASATAYGDQPGVACLKPGLAIVQAAAGSLGAPAVPEVPATATAPAVPAVAAIPAIQPGPILIFQKFREFELSGGPAACKTWVNSTVAGANPLTN